MKKENSFRLQNNAKACTCLLKKRACQFPPENETKIKILQIDSYVEVYICQVSAQTPIYQNKQKGNKYTEVFILTHIIIIMQADFTWISFLKFWSFQQGIMFFIARHILFFKIYDFGRFHKR